MVGESIAICVRGGPTVLLVPEDEQELAEGCADSIETFAPETLRQMPGVLGAVRTRLAEILAKLKIATGLVGVDSGESSQAASYLAMYLYGHALPKLLRELLPGATVEGLGKQLEQVKAVKTSAELSKIRAACAIAKRAYEEASPQLRAGVTEPEAASLFRAWLNRAGTFAPPNQRSDGFAFCMSGPNSAKAYAAYARTRRRTLESNDLAMMHCNSYVDGLWTDITRTFTLGTPDARQKRMYEAVFAAREAALSAIKPGARAADVDSATRQVIQHFGMGDYLKHGTGHGVGFSPMSASSMPRIHTASADVLQEGMVFNVEPALYIEGYGGLRHCDMVAVTAGGYELLTEFQSDPANLALINVDSHSEPPVRSAAAL